MKFEITPAHSPDVMCEFVIPRKGNRQPIEFSVARMEYTPKSGSEAFDAWFTGRTSPQPVLNGEGEPVLDADGNPKTELPAPISDREATLKMLECAGVAAQKLKQLDDLTNGEIAQIWKYWQDASKVTPGESDASGTS